MKKQFLNIKDFVHINLSRGDKSELTEDLISAEKRVDIIKQTCVNTEKKIASCLQTVGGGIDSLSAEKRLKKMPEMQLYQCFAEFAELLGTDSVLGLTLSECSKLQHLMGKELLNYEIDVEKQCLNALTNVIEVDLPNVHKARKQLNKATTDMDTYRVKYQTALKLLQQNAGSGVSSASKAESLKKELEDSQIRVDQSRDSFAGEMFTLLSNESEYAHIFLDYFRLQANYHKKMQELMDVYLPLIERVIMDTTQKPVFGTSLDEHLRVTKREVSLAIEMCVGWLLNNLNEEGLFRIPGSTSKVKKLKSAFDAGIVDIEEYARDPHTVAGALKSYLRELPEPLLTYNLYHEWINAAKISDNDSRLQALWKVCNKLPKANFENLRYLVKFLAKLSNNSDANKMSSQNIAIAISPSLIWPQQQDCTPFDLNMTAANFHSVILDSLIHYCDWFFPGEVNLMSLPLNGDMIINGENNYSGDNKAPQIQRSSKKPAPPVPSSVKPFERTGSLNGNKYVGSAIPSRLSFDDVETESQTNSQLIPTSLDSNVNILRESNASNNSTAHSSVIYSTASLDRPSKISADNQSDRQLSSDKRVSASINLRNKMKEKPNVPPPSVPNRSERPLSVHERPSIPPPERPQRSCDNKVRQRSLECLNDSNSMEEKTSLEDKSSTNNSKLLYPSLHELINSDISSDSLEDSLNPFHENDNSSTDSVKTKSSNEKECISFADDSDLEDNNNDVNKLNIQSIDAQKVKQTIPQKPARALSPANQNEKSENGLQSNIDGSLFLDSKLVNTVENDQQLIVHNLSSTQSVAQQSRPPRPLPPNKPRIAASSEDTYL